MRVAVAGWHSLISVMDVNWYRVYWGAIQNTYYVKCLRKWNKLDSKDQVVLFFLFIWSISFTLICLSIPQIRCVSLCECLTIYPLISSVFGKDFFYRGVYIVYTQLYFILFTMQSPGKWSCSVHMLLPGVCDYVYNVS